MLDTTKELEQAFQNNKVKTFRTKKDAQLYCKHISWRQNLVQKINRRFESIWIVAQLFPENKMVIPTHYIHNNGYDTMQTIVVTYSHKYE